MAKKKIKIADKEIDRPGKAQCALVLLNLLLFIVGILVFLIGLSTKHERMFQKAINFLSKNGLPRPIINMVKQAVSQSGFISFYLITSGLLIATVSFLGCCGAWCSKTLLQWYIKAISIMLLLVLGAGGLTYKEANNAVPHLAVGLGKIFYHYDKQAARKMTIVIQSTGKCCGAFGPHEWFHSSDQFQNEVFGTNFNKYLEDEGLLASVTGSAPVPDSCCTQPSVGCGLKNNVTHQEVFEGFINEIWGNAMEWSFYKEVNYKQEIVKAWDQEAVTGMSTDQAGDYYDDMYDENGNVVWDQQDQWGSNDPYYSYYNDEFSSASAGGVAGSSNSGNYRNAAGRFSGSNQINNGAPNTHVHKYGCAMKFGQRLSRSKPQILVIFALLALPEIICLIMACQIKKYFEELSDAYSD